jgi:acetylglutamate kinase
MEKFVEKASTLIEALPYIKKFRGKEVVIKYGGAAMVNDEIRENVLHDIVFMNFVGIKTVLVHGGGPFITQRLMKAGVQSRFVDGLRVTDKATMKVVIEALSQLNHDIVRDINHFGAEARGLSGHTAEILNVVKRKASEDIGYVGDVTSVNIMPIRELTNFNIIPVIYPIGIDEKGEAYNVNADDAAAKIAAALQAQKMMVLTGVHGIMRNIEDEDSLISTVTLEGVQELLRTKVVSGGMIPKVKSCITALQNGVKKTHIVDGRIKHSLLLEIFTDQGIGTEIVLGNKPNEE